jgi:hypothetical protein
LKNTWRNYNWRLIITRSKTRSGLAKDNKYHTHKNSFYLKERLLQPLLSFCGYFI